MCVLLYLTKEIISRNSKSTLRSYITNQTLKLPCYAVIFMLHQRLEITSSTKKLVRTTSPVIKLVLFTNRVSNKCITVNKQSTVRIMIYAHKEDVFS